MHDENFSQPPLNDSGLTVSIAADEIVIDAKGQAMPALTARGARETAANLVRAADALEASLGEEVD